jgi:hypothetical protein
MKFAIKRLNNEQYKRLDKYCEQNLIGYGSADDGTYRLVKDNDDGTASCFYIIPLKPIVVIVKEVIPLDLTKEFAVKHTIAIIPRTTRTIRLNGRIEHAIERLGI